MQNLSLECRMQHLGFRMQHLGFRMQHLGFRMQHLGFRMQNLSFRPEHSLPSRKGMHSGGTRCSPARTQPCFRGHNYTTSAAPWKSASAPRKLVKDQNLSFRPEHSLPSRKGMHSGGTCCSPARTQPCFRGTTPQRQRSGSSSKINSAFTPFPSPAKPQPQNNPPPTFVNLR
jgi:hypothetical protein